MAWKSMLWNGVSVGDAIVAPYDDVNFNLWLAGPTLANSDSGFVIPGYLHDLEITALSGSRIKVDSGAALLKNYIFINDSPVYFNIEGIETAAWYRYDSIVLQVDYAAQEVRLDLIKGTEKITFPPDAPTLTVDDVLWEVELARIFIDSDPYVGLDEETVSGYTAYIPYYEDCRRFLRTFKSMKSFSDRNLVKNSEWFSSRVTQVAGTPIDWYTDGASWLYLTREVSTGTPVNISTMTRSYALQATKSAAGVAYLRQRIPIHSDINTYSVKCTIKNEDTVTIPLVIKLYGERTNGTSTAKYAITGVRDTGSEETVQTTLTFDETDVKYLIVEISYSGTTAVPATIYIAIGQLVVCEGYNPSSSRAIQEHLFTNYVVTDGSWDGDSKSDGTTSIDFTVSFAKYLTIGPSVALLQTKARDSNSEGTIGAKLEIQGDGGPAYGTLWLGGTVNDGYQHGHAIVNCIRPLYLLHTVEPEADFVVDASGAGTLDAFVELIGMIT